MFNNPFSMVVAIVAIVSIASIIRARYGLHRASGSDHHGRHNCADHDTTGVLENQRLRDEIKALQGRVAVLERLALDSASAPDSNNPLGRAFDKLRQPD